MFDNQQPLLKEGAMRLLLAFLMSVVLTAGLVPSVFAAEPMLSVDKVESLPWGTKVYGLSTLDPSGPKQFSGRLLGVMRNTIGPGHNWIAVELDPATIAVVAGGQSGSPMFIDVEGVSNKIGTLSYADPWARNPICYLTPIAEVINTSHTAPATAIRPPSQTMSAMLSSLLPQGDPARRMLSDTVSTGVGVVGTPEPVVAGSVVGVQLAWGDFDYTAWGTVSHIDGNRVFMFGHPFLQLGPAEYRLVPMKVLTVVQRYDSSYILAAPILGAKPIGIIEQDRETAIYGTLGKEPQNFIPVTVGVTTSGGERRTFSFNTVSDPLVGPVLIGAGVSRAIQSWSRELGDMTLFVNGKLQVEGLGDIEFSDSYASATGPFGMIRDKVGSILGNRFSKARIKGVTVEAKVFDEFRKLSVDSLSLDLPNYKPGDTISVKVTLGQPLRESKTVVLQVPLPKDLQFGVGKVIVGDSDAIERAEHGGGEVVNLVSLVKSLNQLRRPDAVYVYVILPPSHVGPSAAEQAVPLQVGDIAAEVKKTSKRLSSNVEEYQVVVGDFQVSGSREVEFKVGSSGGDLPPGHPALP
jgi:hypothetical protein